MSAQTLIRSLRNIRMPEEMPPELLRAFELITEELVTEAETDEITLPKPTGKGEASDDGKSTVWKSGDWKITKKGGLYSWQRGDAVYTLSKPGGQIRKQHKIGDGEIIDDWPANVKLGVKPEKSEKPGESTGQAEQGSTENPVELEKDTEQGRAKPAEPKTEKPQEQDQAVANEWARLLVDMYKHYDSPRAREALTRLQRIGDVSSAIKAVNKWKKWALAGGLKALEKRIEYGNRESKAAQEFLARMRKLAGVAGPEGPKAEPKIEAAKEELQQATAQSPAIG